jgi:DNA-binding beta-propeller fold protein YncE
MKYFSRILSATFTWSAPLAWVVSICSSPGFAQETPILSLETSISLPSVKGRIDHFSADVKGQRLFVAGVENGTVEVIDVKSGRDVRSIGGLAEPQGVFYEPSTNRLFVACGGDGRVKIFDGSTFQLLATAKFPDDADNLRYDDRHHLVVVGYAGAKALRNKKDGSGGLGFVDSNGKRMGDIVIDAHPESFQLETHGSRIFINVPDKKEIEIVDAIDRKVLSHWQVSAENNFPMALDEAHHRLLVGCWTPPQLLVFDTESGREIASAKISGKTDDLYYDSERRLIYVLTAAGFIDVIRQKDFDHYEPVAKYPVPPGTQTGLFVPQWGKLFAGVRQQGEKDAELRVYRTQ